MLNLLWRLSQDLVFTGKIYKNILLSLWLWSNSKFKFNVLRLSEKQHVTKSGRHIFRQSPLEGIFHAALSHS